MFKSEIVTQIISFTKKYEFLHGSNSTCFSVGNGYVNFRK